MEADIDAIVGVPRAKQRGGPGGVAGRHRHVTAAICSLAISSHSAQLPGDGRQADGRSDLGLGVAGYCGTEEGVKGIEKVGKS